jgi:transglutaminase-like putative cysteine protease
MCLPVSFSFASPSKDFVEKGDDIYDDWDVARTRVYGNDGFFQFSTSTGEFRPIIVFESMGNLQDNAYRTGEQFAIEYPDTYQLAEEIFYFVRDHVRYASDKDEFDRDEFAQNADELINDIEQNGLGYGDCEDMAILLSVMYSGAGLRSAIVLVPGHAATVVYLPEYPNANIFWTLKGESGWVWAEATGRNNQFGKTPPKLIDEDAIFYDVTDLEGKSEIVTAESRKETQIFIPSELIFVFMIFVMFAIPLVRRKKRR